MPIITLRHVVVGAAKADFVKHSIRVSLDLPLTDETLNLRSKLAFLAMEKESITVTLESAQLPLFDDAKPTSENDITDRDGANLLTGEKVFDAVMDTLEDIGNAPGQSGTVTLSHGSRSVTLTNEQFSRSAKNAGRERKPRRMNEHPKNKKRA